jgi:hypothetical protein
MLSPLDGEDDVGAYISPLRVWSRTSSNGFSSPPNLGTGVGRPFEEVRNYDLGGDIVKDITDD